MTKIIIPKNNIKERIYILDVLFNEFIGIEYNFELADVQDYKIILTNGKKLIIEDHFFNKNPLQNCRFFDSWNLKSCRHAYFEQQEYETLSFSFH